MQYTKQREDSFWSADPDGDDIQLVLNMLKSDFRTFGDALISIMQNKLGTSVDNPIDCIQKCCNERNVPLSAIASSGTLRNWFAGKPRPKKSDENRNKMFALAFALDLSIDETKDLFHKAYLDRAFNHRNYRELVYYFCIQHGLPFSTAEAIISQINLSSQSTNDTTIFTRQIISDSDKLAKADDLIAYIHSHSHNFSVQYQTANVITMKLKAKALQYAQEYVKHLRTLAVSSSRQIKEDAQRELREYFHSVDITSDSFLYATITGQRINGDSRKTGTSTLPIASTELPKEIKNNFPQVKSLASGLDSFEELRKVVILLFSYVFWYETRKNDIDLEDKYDQYTSQLDSLLVDANLSPLYYGNPYDWLFMYCSAAQQSLDLFQEFLAEVLDPTDDI